MIFACELKHDLMSIRVYLFIMTVTTASAWIGWIVVLHSIDPVRSGATGFLLFYLTLGISLFGTLSLLGTGIRSWLKGNSNSLILTVRSFRQAILFTILVLLTLWLSSVDLLAWWSMVLVIFIVTLGELFFLFVKRY